MRRTTKTQKRNKGLEIRAVYDEIAESFDAKRHRPWSEVVQFIEHLAPTERLILDLGCGNGRHTVALLERGYNTVALDLSYTLLQIAKQKAGKKMPALRENVLFVNGDGMNLPFKKSSFAAILTIAVIHHLRTKEERKKMVAEIAEKLAVNGMAFISCWLRTHPRFKKEDLRDEIQKGKKEVVVPWTMSDGRKIARFYYLFDPEELEQLCEEVGLEKVKSEIANHNLFLTVRKMENKER